MVAAAAFAAVIAAGPVLAEDLVLICTFDGALSRSFTTTPLVIALDPEGREARVYDPLIYDIYGEPIPADQTREGAQVVLKWVVKNYRQARGGKRANFGYIARWNREKATISVRSHVHGYDNMPAVVYGNCKEERQKAKGKKRKG